MYTGIFKPGIETRHDHFFFFFFCTVDLLAMKLSYAPDIVEFLGEGGWRLTRF